MRTDARKLFVEKLFVETATFEAQLLDSARGAVSELGITGPDLDRAARSYAAELIAVAVRDVGARMGQHLERCSVPSCPLCYCMN